MALAATLALAGPAGATAPDVEGTAAGPSPVHASAQLGTFLPLTQGAALDAQAAWGGGAAGYDSARGRGLFEATAEVRVWGPLSLRGGAVYTGTGDRALRPSLGARVQILHESRHHLDGSVGVFYRPEGLTEMEGEIETVVALGAHLGRTYLVGNLVYGQDPEARERDGEVRLGALRAVASRLLVGVDSRLRFDLGSDRSVKDGKGEPTLDVLVGPLGVLIAGPVALSIHGGASTSRVGATTAHGAFVMGGVGTAF
jgi:hypothetical protein